VRLAKKASGLRSLSAAARPFFLCGAPSSVPAPVLAFFRGGASPLSSSSASALPFLPLRPVVFPPPSSPPVGVVGFTLQHETTP
jgi:hypothetical protein